MSDKASSDLDIFDGLAAKKSRPISSVPSIPPPPGSRAPTPPPTSMARQKTLLGLPVPSAPPPPGVRLPSAPPPPPPPGGRSSPTVPAPRMSAPPLPGQPSAFPLPPPAPAPVTGALPSQPLQSDSGVTPFPSAPPIPAGHLTSSLPPPAFPVPLPKVNRSEEDPTPPINPPEARSNGAAPKAGVDVDWDDEDEATQVFDRTQEDASRSLLLSAPPPPPPPAAGAPASGRIAVPPPPAAGTPASGRVVSPMSRTLSAPPTAPRAPLPPPARTQPTSSFPAPPPMAVPAALSDASPYKQTSSKKTLFLGAAGVVAVAVVASVVALLPKQGSLVVTVAGPGNKPLSELSVFVDGAQRCDTSPCQVRELTAGTHLVRVTAPGYEQTADQAVKVEAGDEAVHNVTLTRGASGSGLTVRAEGRGLKLFVDGKEMGPLPQELADLEPGEHLVRVEGGDRYEPLEKQITIEPGRLATFEPKLKVKKGLATIKPGSNAAEARVVLVSGNERRPVPQLPLAVDIPVDKPYSIVATKPGFQDFEQKLEFEDGQAERTFVIDLLPAAEQEAPIAAAGRPAPVAAPRYVAPPRAPAPAAAAPAPAAAKAAAGNGTLSLSSTPPSNVILDGRPLGSTPKAGVSVAPGPHTVIFVHSELGRKAKTVTVQPGKTTAVAVAFE
ncbi:MAG TPA: carboxypeptidase regulatory-like domain-containing protein [Polyangiaceae bacterium]|nr:carboxypeptidase regulatory-like domain-containing protein [Polyangiaceae bacterium]